MVLALPHERGRWGRHCLLLLWFSGETSLGYFPPTCWNSLKAAFQEGRGEDGPAQGEQQWPLGGPWGGPAWPSLTSAEGPQLSPGDDGELPDKNGLS